MSACQLPLPLTPSHPQSTLTPTPLASFSAFAHCLLSLFVPATGDWRLWLEYGYRVTQARLGYQCPINVSMQCMQCRRDQRQASHDMAESLCCMLSLLQHSRPRRQATRDRNTTTDVVGTTSTSIIRAMQTIHRLQYFSTRVWSYQLVVVLSWS